MHQVPQWRHKRKDCRNSNWGIDAQVLVENMDVPAAAFAGQLRLGGRSTRVDNADRALPYSGQPVLRGQQGLGVVPGGDSKGRHSDQLEPGKFASTDSKKREAAWIPLQRRQDPA